MKGVSALIGAVLVLTVTVATVSVFAGWAPQLVQGITDTTENQTEQEVRCNDAELRVITAKHDSGNTTVAFRNEGSIDFNEVRIEAWRDDLPQNSATTSADSGALVSKNVTTDNEPDRIEVISTACNNAKDSTEDIS